MRAAGRNCLNSCSRPSTTTVGRSSPVNNRMRAFIVNYGHVRFGPILKRSFYDRETSEVARDLLGKVVVHGKTAGIIVETEAYPGGDDLASHSARGLTERTRVIFGPPGHAYVYFIYGMYECLNVVVGSPGTPGCVLVRALEPVDGIDTMRQRRPSARKIEDLANGPGKLTLALGITRAQYGADFTCGSLVIRQPAESRPLDIAVTPRIGITHCADAPLRFLVRSSPFVSRAPSRL
jgi:DNA-3-methyladenine glycosylase